MDPIAWDIHYGLPSQKYLEYVSSNLLGGNVSVDPFSPFVVDSTDNIYVSRGSVESELTQPGNRIVLGSKGGGGTTLVRWLAKEMLYSLHSVRYQTLAVNLSSVDDMQPLGKEQSSPQLRLWSMQQLIALIFNAYWNQMVIEPLYRATLLPLLRKDREWMLKLHWFYNHYPPLHYQVLHDFELLTWLASNVPYSPFGPGVKEEDILRELVSFVTTVPFDPRKVFGETFHWPYRKILLIFDLTGNLSADQFNAFIRFILALRSLALPDWTFRVFLNVRWEKQLVEWLCVESGYVTLYKLPHWRAQELQDILDGRVAVYGWEFRDRSGEVAQWADHLPGLNDATHYHFRRILIDGALRAYKCSTNYDAPIHALKLARGLVAACAGCWEDRYPPPLNAHQLQEIVDLYWEEEKCDV